MGWPTHAVVALYCEGRMAAAEVRAAIADHPELSAAFTVAGEASAILRAHPRHGAPRADARAHPGRAGDHAHAEAGRPLDLLDRPVSA